MKSFNILRKTLSGLENKGYKAYKSIKGEYDFGEFCLIIDHVQGDPFAQPSRFRVRIDRKKTGFSSDVSRGKSRTIALCDYLTRRFAMGCGLFSGGVRGSGKSGIIMIDTPAQEVIERSSMVVTDEYIEARFFLALPAMGRRISSAVALSMLFDELPMIIDYSMFHRDDIHDEVHRHVETSEDADYLRGQLEGNGLIGFVADGALLPRASGIDPAPLVSENAVFFNSPEELRQQFKLPNSGIITGMGIPKGVTLIVGGGFHGKSTLLKALEAGIYNHIPGDGREFVVSLKSSVKIRASDGRCITQTDISEFINNLPHNKDTVQFCTENASGSTSQAANISEAIEVGATVLLLDEDTSATNFMIRDFRMQQLVTSENEPITPFIDKVQALYSDHGISTVIVMGGCGDYFNVADHVIQMKNYQPHDVTEKARMIAGTCGEERKNEGGVLFRMVKHRIPHDRSFNPYREKGKLKISAPRLNEVLIGWDTITFFDVEQLVEHSQTRAMANAVNYALKYMDNRRTLKEITDQVLEDIETHGLDILVPWCTGDLAVFRSMDLAAVINRARTLRVRHKQIKCG